MKDAIWNRECHPSAISRYCFLCGRDDREYVLSLNTADIEVGGEVLLGCVCHECDPRDNNQ